MEDKEFQIGDKISCLAISGNYIVGRIIRILQNTIIVSNGIETEVVRKKDLQETSLDLDPL